MYQPRPARWLIPELQEDVVNRLINESGLTRASAKILANRGIDTPDAARRFLKPSLDDLHDPFRLKSMREAAPRLARAIANREHILLYGDYDVDGTTAVVILKKSIELAGGQATYHVPHRIIDGYGMKNEVIEEAVAKGVTLVVSVDTGIRAAEVVKRATELGIDVIVTDHHLPEEALPPALAVLNPNRPDCDYPDKNLCGAAVALKLAMALFEALEWSANRRRKLLESFLKLVAIATVADVVPLVGENRIFVAHGLEGLRNPVNPGLRALLEMAEVPVGERPTSREISHQVAPRINAAGRMEHARHAIELFLSNNDHHARELAKQLNVYNGDRRKSDAEIFEAISKSLESTPITDEQFALVFSSAGWNRGVVGIVASRLVEQYCRPVFVLSEENGKAKGSGRSAGDFHLLNALEAISDLFEAFGGHKHAAGVTLPLERVEEFRARFSHQASLFLTPDDFCPRHKVDAHVELRELTEAAVEQILQMAPFGFGNPQPLLAAEGVEVAGLVHKSEKFTRIALRQNGFTLEPIKEFRYATRSHLLQQGATIDVLINISEDAYSARRGYAGWQATLQDIRAVATAASL